jgi:hypothetical protein
MACGTQWAAELLGVSATIERARELCLEVLHQDPRWEHIREHELVVAVTSAYSEEDVTVACDVPVLLVPDTEDPGEIVGAFGDQLARIGIRQVVSERVVVADVPQGPVS